MVIAMGQRTWWRSCTDQKGFFVVTPVLALVILEIRRVECPLVGKRKLLRVGFFCVLLKGVLGLRQLGPDQLGSGAGVGALGSSCSSCNWGVGGASLSSFWGFCLGSPGGKTRRSRCSLML